MKLLYHIIIVDKISHIYTMRIYYFILRIFLNILVFSYTLETKGLTCAEKKSSVTFLAQLPYLYSFIVIEGENKV